MKIAKLFIALFVININAYAQKEDYAELEWAKTFIGPDSNNSVSKGMALDKEGNIYVAVDDVAAIDSGFSHDYVIIKYNWSGQDELKLRYSPKIYSYNYNQLEEIILDNIENVYVAGTCTGHGYDKSYVTLKYNLAGVLQWNAITTVSHNIPVLSSPVGLAVDYSGNVYMASHTMDVYKYDINGKLIWNTPINTNYFYSMALDDEANIYLGGEDFILKYNSNGLKQWEVKDSLYHNVTIIKGNNVYFCGAGLSKYNLEGIKQWSVLNTGYYMTVDNDGNPVTFGDYYNGIYDQFRVIKFDTNGVKLWESFIEYPSFYLFSNRDICTDRFNNIYIAGYIVRVDGNSDIITAKFSPSGEQKWIMRYNGFPDAPASGEPIVVVKVDSTGNVYISAVTVFNQKQEQTVTIKYRQPNFPVSVKQENIDKYSFQLFQNYPNPFNPKTNIKYSLKENGQVQIDIINVQGQTIKRLVNEEKSSGIYNVVWDGQTDKGFSAASGIYICRLLVKPALSGIPINIKSIKLLLIK